MFTFIATISNAFVIYPIMCILFVNFAVPVLTTIALTSNSIMMHLNMRLQVTFLTRLVLALLTEIPQVLMSTSDVRFQ